MILRPCLALIGIATLLCVFATSSYASNVRKPEEVRSAFIYNIPKYTDWPTGSFASKLSPVNFCFLEQQFKHASLLETGTALHIDKRNIAVIRLDSIQSDSVRDCHVLFVSKRAESEQVFDTISTLNKSMVTIGESLHFLRKGGMSGIVPFRGKMRIFMNKEIVNSSALKFGKQLLRRVQFDY